MGNHQSHEGKLSVAESGGSSHGSGNSTPRNGSRRGDGPEPQEKPQPTSMVPVEKLAKVLVQRSQKEDGVNGVTENTFTKYLFPKYPELGTAFYKYIHKCGKCKNKHIPQTTFRQQCEKILGMLDDTAIIETYVRMFALDSEEMTPDLMRNLLYTSYKISMDHYPEGPQTCLLIHRTLSSAVDGCFNKKDSHSVGFVVRWLEQHTHRLVMPLHRYSVHVLSTRYRELALLQPGPGQVAQWEVGTPVLQEAARGGLLAPSAAWLLAAAAPPVYSLPLVSTNKASGSPMSAWLSRQVCVVPSHWTPLYVSREHGLAANRFLHHTLAYRGPTLVVIEFDEFQVVICNSQEWRETHQYTGGPDSALIQLYPTLCMVEHAPKMLYLNTSIRGYPKGLRAGSDPRKPLLIVDEAFENITYKGAPYILKAIEVWGCGDQNSRETQLEIKKWQVREAERQRAVKLSAADWMEHPDRYLLELAGRPQYNNSAS